MNCFYTFDFNNIYNRVIPHGLAPGKKRLSYLDLTIIDIRHKNT